MMFCDREDLTRKPVNYIDKMENSITSQTVGSVQRNYADEQSQLAAIQLQFKQEARRQALYTAQELSRGVGNDAVKVITDAQMVYEWLIKDL